MVMQQTPHCHAPHRAGVLVFETFTLAQLALVAVTALTAQVIGGPLTLELCLLAVLIGVMATRAPSLPSG